MSERATVCAVLAVAMLAAHVEAAPPAEQDPEVRTACFEARFGLEGARPLALTAHLVDASGREQALELVRPLEPDPLRIGAGDAGLDARLARLRYRVERQEDEGAVTLIFRAPLEPGTDVVERYTFARQGCSIEVSAALESGAHQATGAPLALDLSANSALSPRPADGLGGLSERLEAVQVDPDGARELGAVSGSELAPGSWVGLRSRFWALLASPLEHGARVEARQHRVQLRSDGPGPLRVRLYVGPLERPALAAVDPSLTGLLFAGRSPPIRVLCVGLSAILGGLLALLGHAGLAVVLLSPTVKLLLLPLTRIAERWQREVDDARTRLAPRLAEIRARYRGEERSRRALDLHRELGVPAFYGLKSLLGVAIQLPVFIAAFHVLDESSALLGARLLWIQDLSLADRLGTLPFRVPFLGDGLNLLPFVMTAVTILSTQLHRGGPQDPELRRRQRRGLHAMAAGFLLLFYTFPAGMVLYWTTNSASALLFQWLGDRVLVAPSSLVGTAPEWRAWRG